jgi:hypothetical protein
MKKALFFILVFAFSVFCFFACKEDPINAVVVNPAIDKNTAELIERIIVPTKPNGNIDSSALAKIVFEQDIFFFDSVKAGSLVSKSFSFSNHGNGDLYILDTQSSCGCTVAAFTKDPIATGEKSEISINFDTSNKKGQQKKQIIVFTNSIPNKSILTLQGFVE